MSFIKKFFSFTSKEETKTEKFDIDKNYNNCIAIPLPYTVKAENEIIIEQNIINKKETNPKKTKKFSLDDSDSEDDTEDNFKKENNKKISKIDLDLLRKNFIKKIDEFQKNSKFLQYKDEFRPESTSSKGGIKFEKQEITSLLRSSATDIIAQIGKKLITGDFNLTTVAFPIKVMIPISILQSIARSFFQFPYYCHLASLNSSPVEKMKYVITASMSSLFCSSLFLKPMNPILGETYEAIFSDGTKVFMEQTSHHPPVSHYELVGQNYYMSGFSVFKSSAGLNSMTVINNGKKMVKFTDGTEIKFDFCKVSFHFIIKNYYTGFIFRHFYWHT